jgi:ribosomal protein S18 acetylase RimI-like enzyme
VSLAGPSLFCTPELAARIERAESSLMAAAALAAGRRDPSARAFATPVAGGMATFARDGSPFNKVSGLGFAGPPAGEELDAVERAFAERGAAVQVELGNLGDPDVAPLLVRRGYELVSFENVLGVALDAPVEPAQPPRVQIARSEDGDFDDWLAVSVGAVAEPDTAGVPWHETFAAQALEDAERDFLAAGAIRYSAFRDGRLAGAASFRAADGIAQMTGAATAPEHRRRGIHTALLAARLADAAAAGCDVAVVTTQPGSRSQHNVQRCGFDLLYTRAILVKPAE